MVWRSGVEKQYDVPITLFRVMYSLGTHKINNNYLKIKIIYSYHMVIYNYRTIADYVLY